MSIKVEFQSREQLELLVKVVSITPLQGDLNALLAATQQLNDARARMQQALKEHAEKNGEPRVAAASPSRATGGKR